MQSKRRPFHRSISLLARLSITRSTRASPGSVLKKKRAMLVAVLFFVRVRPSVLPGNAALSKCQLPMPRLGRFAAPIMFRRNAPSVRPCDRSNLAALVSHTKSFSASFVIIYGPFLFLHVARALMHSLRREQLPPGGRVSEGKSGRRGSSKRCELDPSITLPRSVMHWREKDRRGDGKGDAVFHFPFNCAIDQRGHAKKGASWLCGASLTTGGSRWATS